LQCNRGRGPNALATRFLLIAGGILAARKLAQYEGGTRVSATVGAITDAIPRIMDEIGGRHPAMSTQQAGRAS
jgi:hypothetical protein